jgi:hypothetical protein
VGAREPSRRSDEPVSLYFRYRLFSEAKRARHASGVDRAIARSTAPSLFLGMLNPEGLIGSARDAAMRLATRSMLQLMLHQRKASMSIYWKNPPVGVDFATAINWVQDVVPGASDIAEMTHSGIVVSATSPVTVLGINLGSSSSFEIADGTTFTATEGTPAGGAYRGLILVEGRFNVGGTLNNSGTVGVVNPDGTLAVDGFDLTVRGGGQVVLGGADIFVAAGRALSNVDNTIEGNGVISGAGTLVNQSNGIIKANGGIGIDIATRNQGTIEATLGGHLQIDGSVINNTGGGVIRADDTSSVGIGTDTSIIGGTVTTHLGDPNSFFLITGTNTTFDGGKSVVPTNTMITINGDVRLDSSAGLNLKGTINNSGSIDCQGSSTLVLLPSGTNSTVTLKGSAAILLDSPPGDAQITGGGSVVTLDNVNNTIFGAGSIGGAGLKLKNEIGGLVDAVGHALIIDTE